MAGHLGAIGFPATTRDEFEALGVLAASLGEAFEGEGGALYLRWAPGEGVELWAQADAGTRKLRGLNPYFSSGRARLTLRVEAVREDPKRLQDGSVVVVPPVAGGIPASLVLPDFRVARPSLAPGAVGPWSIAAFAHALETFESLEGLRAAPGGVPPGTIVPAKGSGIAVVAGKVVASSLLTNPSSRRDFGWVLLEVDGGRLDVVLDEEFLAKPLPAAGHFLRGVFWLCARATGDDTQKS